jgi:lipopolysaccharide/colanic/teichoic acid biosynthesis glycosyltransferase
MIADAEADGPQFARPNDDRVTRIGRFIRKTRIDEIPQTINVLRGDMSFVGPRPERPEFVAVLEREITNYHLRHIVKPGITGWAQVQYCYTASVEGAREKLRYDLYYIRHFSPLLDIWIILKTVRVTLFGVGGR